MQFRLEQSCQAPHTHPGQPGRVALTLLDIPNQYTGAGSDLSMSRTASTGYFNQMTALQILARATRDYYDLMLTALIYVVVILLLMPRIQNVILKLKKGTTPY